uniref:Uncharacterized protein n=1 Tax=viral metagenome TaxID=1070528 RepID=A0A6H1ZS36_9ZZZZ
MKDEHVSKVLMLDTYTPCTIGALTKSLYDVAELTNAIGARRWPTHVAPHLQEALIHLEVALRVSGLALCEALKTEAQDAK